MGKPQLGILISGRGSNMQALVRAAKEHRLDADVRVVISNVADAAGLVFAREAGIETLVISQRDFARREAFDHALAAALKARRVSLICLAGFMRLLGPAFCEAFPNQILNIHPSLLPSFPGVDAQHQALDYGVKVTGATVHFVTPALDAGPIVLQEAVPVLEHDTPRSLSERILAVEHGIYARAVARILGGQWRVEGRRVVFAGESTEEVVDNRPEGV
jgi:phosphoribosylglycinamide formyltransferase-1